MGCYALNSPGPAPSPIGRCAWGESRDPLLWSRRPVAAGLPGIRVDSQLVRLLSLC